MMNLKQKKQSEILDTNKDEREGERSTQIENWGSLMKIDISFWHFLHWKYCDK